MNEEQATPQTFDLELAKAGQKKLCNERVFPHFAPYDGRCYNCRQIIYEQVDHGTYKTGHSVETASNSLITGCPHCCHSYCD